MANCLNWEYPGEFLTIPYNHEIEYCKEEFDNGFFNIIHASNGIKIVRFIPTDKAVIILFADPCNNHDLFTVQTEPMYYEKYLEDQIEGMRTNPQKLNGETFKTRVIRLSEELALAKKLKEDYLSQLLSTSCPP